MLKRLIVRWLMPEIERQELHAARLKRGYSHAHRQYRTALAQVDFSGSGGSAQQSEPLRFDITTSGDIVVSERMYP